MEIRDFYFQTSRAITCIPLLPPTYLVGNIYTSIYSRKVFRLLIFGKYFFTWVQNLKHTLCHSFVGCCKAAKYAMPKKGHIYKSPMKQDIDINRNSYLHDNGASWCQISTYAIHASTLLWLKALFTFL